MIFNPIIGGKKLPTLSNPGSENDLLEGKQLIDEFGNPLTGTIPIKTETDISVNGNNIIIPSGYYDSQVSKSVETTTQSTPSINVSSSGLITASSAQDEGYVYAGTKSSTQQLPTQSGTTITPGTTQKVAVTSGKYTTGDINVAGSANLVANNIKSGINIFGVIGNLSSLKIWSGWNLSGSFGYGTFTITFPEITSINKVYAAVISIYLLVNNQPSIPTPLLIISPHMVEGTYARFSGMYVGKYNITISGNSLVFNSITSPNNYTNSLVQTGNAAVNYLIYE